MFNWPEIFHYDSKYNGSNEIATDTADISVGVSDHVKIPPGQFYYISSVDDRNSTAHQVFFVTAN